MLVAGVDCSTQATKVLVVDADDGRVVAAGRAAHEVTGAGGARETHPDVWWEALSQALAQTRLAGQVRALSVAGQQHGLVTVGADGRPLRPAVLWNDTRAAAAASRLVDQLGGARAWAELVGVVPVASFTVSKWAWLREAEPDVARATRAVRLPHDWLTGELTGEAATDRGDASGTGWWSAHTGGYQPRVLSMEGVELEPGLLPPVLGPRQAAGEVTARAAGRLGLRPRTLVGPGTGDNMGAAVGLGLEPGVPVISLGTSGTAYAASDRPAADADGLVAGFADATGRFLPLACTLNATLAVERVAGWLGLPRDAVPDRTDVVALPYFDGERTPNLPLAAASVTGLRHDSTPGDILLAVYEGAVASLIDALDQLGEHGSGLRADAPVILIGGGAQGHTWRRTVARLSGRSLQIPEAEELVALGAAAQAAAVLVGDAPDEVARRWDTAAGTSVDALERDHEALARIRRVRDRLQTLNTAAFGV